MISYFDDRQRTVAGEWNLQFSSVIFLAELINGRIDFENGLSLRLWMIIVYLSLPSCTLTFFICTKLKFLPEVLRWNVERPTCFLQQEILIFIHLIDSNSGLHLPAINRLFRSLLSSSHYLSLFSEKQTWGSNKYLSKRAFHITHTQIAMIVGIRCNKKNTVGMELTKKIYKQALSYSGFYFYAWGICNPCDTYRKLVYHLCFATPPQHKALTCYSWQNTFVPF